MPLGGILSVENGDLVHPGIGSVVGGQRHALFGYDAAVRGAQQQPQGARGEGDPRNQPEAAGERDLGGAPAGAGDLLSGEDARRHELIDDDRDGGRRQSGGVGDLHLGHRTHLLDRVDDPRPVRFTK